MVEARLPSQSPAAAGLRKLGVVCAALMVAIACTPPAPPTTTTKPGLPLVRIGGSDTMGRALIPDLVETHKRTRKNLEFELSGGGSGLGIRQLLDGTLDIAAASRSHRPVDQEQAEQLGFSLNARGARTIIGLDVVAVVVHPSSPIESLTYDEVIGIFCTRSIDDEAFLGHAQGPLRPLARDPRSGTRALFEDFFCGPSGIHHRIPSGTTDQIATSLSEDRYAISFASMTEGVGKVVKLKADANAEPVEPSQKNIANGRYPLYHDLYLYTAGPASGPAKDFIDWVLSPAGQEVMDEQRFVPIYHRTAVFDGPRPLRETIHFDAGRTMPNQRSMARIQLLVQELQQRGGQGTHIVLEGFTDDSEDDAIALSEQRAETVRDLLSQQLPGSFFEIIPRGAIRPLAPNNTPYGRERNRRVQIYLASEEKVGDEVVVQQGEEGAP